jgi:hypothetical protein
MALSTVGSPLRCGRQTHAPEINFTSPIGFGDRPDRGTVEGHLNAMEEAAETQRYNKRTNMSLKRRTRIGNDGLVVRSQRHSSSSAYILKTVLANLDSLREFKANERHEE